MREGPGLSRRRLSSSSDTRDRTHRERKELYIKALEDEVLRLKEIFSNISQDKQRLAEENRQLKALLVQNGLGSLAATSSVLDDSMSNPSVGYSPGTSLAGSYVPASSNTSAFTPPPLSAGGGISPHSATYPHGSSGGHQQQLQHSAGGHGHAHLGGGGGMPSQLPGFDYEQAGIDFVLA